MKEFFDKFKTKNMTTFFAMASFASGFLFLSGTLTGNIILEERATYNLLSVIGLLLILCSVILGAYSLKKK